MDFRRRVWLWIIDWIERLKKRWYIWLGAFVFGVIEDRYESGINQWIDRQEPGNVLLGLLSFLVSNLNMIALYGVGSIILGLLVHAYFSTAPARAIAEKKNVRQKRLSGPGIVLHSIAPLDEKITVEARNHPHGILIFVKQRIDTDRAFTCTVSILDIKKKDGGLVHAVPDLHDKNGEFNRKGVNLDYAGGGNNELFYNTERQWWLVQSSSQRPFIRHWILQQNGSRGTNLIYLQEGTWVASLEAHVGDFSIRKDVTYTWDGSNKPHLQED